MTRDCSPDLTHPKKHSLQLRLVLLRLFEGGLRRTGRGGLS